MSSTSIKVLVFCTTEFGDRKFAPGVHELTPSEAQSFYINGWARPATQAELADPILNRAQPPAEQAPTGNVEAAVLSSTGEAAVVARTRAPRARAGLSALSSQLSAS